MSASPIKALLFDLGGVLIDIDFTRTLRVWAGFSALSFEALREVFEHDLAYQQHETGEIDAKAYYDSLRTSLKLDGSDQQIEAGWNAIFVSEISQTVQAVRKARAQFPCYLFTNSNPTHQLLWSTQFADIFTALEQVFVSSEIGLRKPHRAAFDYIARAIGVPASSILFFDDMPENVSGALDAGFRAVHVRSPADVQAALRSLGCTL